MSAERWGAFSVIDYRDARKLAVEVLLYDRLLIPTPMDWDRARWIEKGWEPDRLDDRLKQLGDIAIRAAWDQDAQKDWKQKYDALQKDVQDINKGPTNALGASRRVLAEQWRKYRPEGVDAVLAFEAYQSEADFRKSETGGRGHPTEPMAEFDFLVAQRIAVPEEKDAEEELKRAVDLAHQKDFRDRRSRFHDWQHDLLSRGVLPEDATGEFSHLVGAYNEVARSAKRSYRIETAMLVGSLGAVALAALASQAPALFAGIGIGLLKGTQVVQIGTAATGAVLQIAKHLRGRPDPDAMTRADLSGAMFHQIEEELGWELRVGQK